MAMNDQDQKFAETGAFMPSTGGQQQQQLRCATLDAAYGDPERYFNRHTRIIALDGPRGVLLANYVARDVRPNHRTQEFLVYYPEDYTPHRGRRVPRTAPGDIRAFAVPVEIERDSRLTIESGFAHPAMDSDKSMTSRDWDMITNGRTLMDANGMSARPHSIEMHVDGTGVSLDGRGMSLKGALHVSQPEERGVTKENPAWSMIPKTAVTFPFADFIPNMAELERISTFVVQLRESVKLVTELVSLVTDTFR